MAAQKNGNNGAVPLLDSVSPSIVLPDGRPYSFGQITDNGSGVQDRDTVDALQTGSAEPQPINFRVFPDGTVVELVRSQSPLGRLRFLIWNAEAVKFQESFDYEGSQFVPPRIHVS